MQRIFGPPANPTPMQPYARNPFMFGPGPGMPPPTAFFGQGPQAAQGFIQGAGGRVGLLARLFGGGGGAGSALASSAFPSTAAAGGGSFLSGINFSSILQNAQRIMGITQQVMPMVQQYGPIIRNAPTLWRIMRSQSSEQETEPNDESQPIILQDSAPIPSPEQPPSQVIFSQNQVQPPSPSTPESVVGGMPGPKLYV
ncbi:VrrA/YqfQ family protein [Alkalicoccobacillus murimartini]|uniref:YqfQ-like protein n=1 Tax=Alkalicoccobacillus murimartini TaxID=171685 RepID=A0ABT9YDE8_9BACI|nr:VrrA/YqfQ family protein [Alkalicoccobacillus murimartini]MDQ0205561.1 hypothetical protein [Alkalicoccobacillus murimartini]